MSVNSEKFIHDYANRMAPMSHRQMPVFSQVGKGLRGDSSRITLQEDGANTYLQGEYDNQMTGETEELWQLPLLDMVPQLHYEVWQGVEELDGVATWYYYIKFTYSITIDGSTRTFWTFNTPHTYTNPFHGTTIPAETKIEEQ